MKSKIEVRKFAVEMAVAVLGQGTAQKDVVEKAKEIEAYIVGESSLPETFNEGEAIADAFGGLMPILGKAMGIEEDKTAKKK